MNRLGVVAAAILLANSTTAFAQTLPSGRYQMRPITPSAACVTFDPGFGARLPFAKHVQCPPGPPREEANFWWEFARQADGTYQIMHSITRTCATVARGVIFGPPAIDLRTCENPIPADQKWKLVPLAGGTVFQIQTGGGKCWYWRYEAYNSEHIVRDCGLSSAFTLRSAN